MPIYTGIADSDSRRADCSIRVQDAFAVALVLQDDLEPLRFSMSLSLTPSLISVLLLLAW